MTAKQIVIVAALDTKAAEAALIRDYVAARGHSPVVVDVGVLGEPGIPAQVSREDVTGAGGVELGELRAGQEKARAMEVMTRGAAVVALKLRAAGRLDGIVAIGGSAGTAIGTSAMRALPLGVPKVMLSTVAAGDIRAFVGTKDVTMMYSVVDIAGI